ncbi:MAG: 50S ribosomal protein L22 [Candidatus Omnitrophota bacterium]|nr:50S ribosomal protein L22 [Candidatus Omnitrophota bacterium]
MISRAIARYIRISPPKVRQVTRLIQREDAQKALVILSGVKRKSVAYIAKVLKSAISNAKRKPDIKEENLYISRIIVDNGPALKRFRPRAMGRAAPILKRTSHITVELDKKPFKAQISTDKKNRSEQMKKTDKRRSVYKRS